eukprot:Clim_evm144s210 gene=Clim_evmTU144s210
MAENSGPWKMDRNNNDSVSSSLGRLRSQSISHVATGVDWSPPGAPGSGALGGPPPGYGNLFPYGKTGMEADDLDHAAAAAAATATSVVTEALSRSSIDGEQGAYHQYAMESAVMMQQPPVNSGGNGAGGKQNQQRMPGGAGPVGGGYRHRASVSGAMQHHYPGQQQAQKHMQAQGGYPHYGPGPNKGGQTGPQQIPYGQQGGSPAGVYMNRNAPAFYPGGDAMAAAAAAQQQQQQGGRISQSFSGPPGGNGGKSAGGVHQPNPEQPYTDYLERRLSSLEYTAAGVWSQCLAENPAAQEVLKQKMARFTRDARRFMAHRRLPTAQPHGGRVMGSRRNTTSTSGNGTDVEPETPDQEGPNANPTSATADSPSSAEAPKDDATVPSVEGKEDSATASKTASGDNTSAATPSTPGRGSESQEPGQQQQQQAQMEEKYNRAADMYIRAAELVHDVLRVVMSELWGVESVNGIGATLNDLLHPLKGVPAKCPDANSRAAVQWCVLKLESMRDHNDFFCNPDLRNHSAQENVLFTVSNLFGCVLPLLQTMPLMYKVLASISPNELGVEIVEGGTKPMADANVTEGELSASLGSNQARNVWENMPASVRDGRPLSGQSDAASDDTGVRNSGSNSSGGPGSMGRYNSGGGYAAVAAGGAAATAASNGNGSISERPLSNRGGENQAATVEEEDEFPGQPPFRYSNAAPAHSPGTDNAQAGMDDGWSMAPNMGAPTRQSVAGGEYAGYDQASFAHGGHHHPRAMSVSYASGIPPQHDPSGGQGGRMHHRASISGGAVPPGFKGLLNGEVKKPLTPPCQSLFEGTQCRRQKCAFLHTWDDVFDSNPSYKSSLCRNMGGECAKKQNCAFAHGEEELRLIDQKRKEWKARRYIKKTPASAGDGKGGVDGAGGAGETGGNSGGNPMPRHSMPIPVNQAHFSGAAYEGGDQGSAPYSARASIGPGAYAGAVSRGGGRGGNGGHGGYNNYGYAAAAGEAQTHRGDYNAGGTGAVDGGGYGSRRTSMF